LGEGVAGEGARRRAAAVATADCNSCDGEEMPDNVRRLELLLVLEEVFEVGSRGCKRMMELSSGAPMAEWRRAYGGGKGGRV
jgi:hypothetical protein